MKILQKEQNSRNLLLCPPICQNKRAITPINSLDNLNLMKTEHFDHSSILFRFSITLKDFTAVCRQQLTDKVVIEENNIKIWKFDPNKIKRWNKWLTGQCYKEISKSYRKWYSQKYALTGKLITSSSHIFANPRPTNQIDEKANFLRKNTTIISELVVSGFVKTCYIHSTSIFAKILTVLFFFSVASTRSDGLRPDGLYPRWN